MCSMSSAEFDGEQGGVPVETASGLRTEALLHICLRVSIISVNGARVCSSSLFGQRPPSGRCREYVSRTSQESVSRPLQYVGMSKGDVFSAAAGPAATEHRTPGNFNLPEQFRSRPGIRCPAAEHRTTKNDDSSKV